MRLPVFPEFAHAAPSYPTLGGLHAERVVDLPDQHPDRPWLLPGLHRLAAARTPTSGRRWFAANAFDVHAIDYLLKPGGGGKTAHGAVYRHKKNAPRGGRDL
jgi:hypothetical protein